MSKTKMRSGAAETEYWQACWSESDGKRKSVKFSVAKYGEDRARRMAIRARREAAAASVSAA